MADGSGGKAKWTLSFLRFSTRLLVSGGTANARLTERASKATFVTGTNSVLGVCVFAVPELVDGPASAE